MLVGNCRPSQCPTNLKYKSRSDLQVSAISFTFSHASRCDYVACAILYPLPFLQELIGLQVIEDRLSEGIDAAQNGKIALVIRGDDSVQHHPFAAFTQIIFELDDERHGHSGQWECTDFNKLRGNSPPAISRLALVVWFCEAPLLQGGNPSLNKKGRSRRSGPCAAHSPYCTVNASDEKCCALPDVPTTITM